MQHFQVNFIKFVYMKQKEIYQDEIEFNESGLRLQAQYDRAMRVLRVIGQVLVIAALAFLFASCTKAPAGSGTKCWTCTTIVNQTGPFGNSSSTSADTLCNRTQEQISAIEKDGTYTTHGVGVTVSKTQTCQ